MCDARMHVQGAATGGAVSAAGSVAGTAAARTLCIPLQGYTVASASCRLRIGMCYCMRPAAWCEHCSRGWSAAQTRKLKVAGSSWPAMHCRPRGHDHQHGSSAPDDHHLQVLKGQALHEAGLDGPFVEERQAAVALGSHSCSHPWATHAVVAPCWG